MNLRWIAGGKWLGGEGIWFKVGPIVFVWSFRTMLSLDCVIKRQCTFSFLWNIKPPKGDEGLRFEMMLWLLARRLEVYGFSTPFAEKHTLRKRHD